VFLEFDFIIPSSSGRHQAGGVFWFQAQ
jgi:hypothetical protein